MKVKWTPERILRYAEYNARFVDREDLEEMYARKFLEDHLFDKDWLDDMLAEDILQVGKKEMRKVLG